MAIINVDDAYILNETGAQVDKTTGIPFKNESLTEAEAAQARANIRAGGSNPNLLDNAYFVGGGSQLGDGVFPINQRGLTSYSGNGNTIDRLKCNDPVGVLSLSASGMSITVGTQFCGYQQYLPMGALVEGETYTFSIKINGTVYAWTIPSLSTSGQSMAAGWFGNNNIYSYIGVLNGNWRIMPFDSANGTTATVSGIQAMKLELGTVSTLANDTPPDYGTELLKCMRYFIRLTGYNNENFGFGYAIAGTIGVIHLPIPVPMRTTPTVSTNGSFNLIGAGAAKTVTAIGTPANGINGIQVQVTSSSLTTNQSYMLVSAANGTYIDLSADL